MNGEALPHAMLKLLRLLLGLLPCAAYFSGSRLLFNLVSTLYKSKIGFVNVFVKDLPMPAIFSPISEAFSLIEKEMTQEKLAELTKLSTPHISHIENGTTKLGLPTIVKIANILNVSVDKLLCDSLVSSQHIYNAELSELMSDCSPYELRSMIDMLIAVKKIMRNRKNYEV